MSTCIINPATAHNYVKVATYHWKLLC